MACLYPTLVPNKKFEPNQKNGGNPPTPKHRKTTKVPASCGKCKPCRKKLAREWNIRLSEHIKVHKNGKMVLLTFNDEEYTKLDQDVNPIYKGYDRDNNIGKLGFQRFADRYRKLTGHKLHCWVVTELGPNNTERLHIHGIIWTNETKETITKLWKYGYCGRGRTWRESNNYVNAETIGYITKYLFKTDLKHPNYTPIILCSNGIGASYTKTAAFKEHKFNGKNTKEYYRTTTGHKTGLPAYIRNKAYTDEEKEELWIETLEKNIRYIGQQRFDTSTKKGETEYLAALKWAQQENKRLGYGTSKKNWDQIKYENQLRDLKRETRLLKQLEKKKISGDPSRKA